jgi:nucleoside-diphosphate-sugar epimerase
MILVTGATGFIGSHLVDALCARGRAVRSLVRPSGMRRNPPPGEVVYGDLTSGKGLVEALSGVSVVIHLAGATKALAPIGYHRENVQAAELVAQAAASRGIRLVHVSSLAAVGPSADGTPLIEQADPHPLTHYGRSKLAGEKAVREIVPEAVIVRPPVVYGPRDTGVLQMLKPLAHGVALRIGGGERWFSAIYVKDLVNGLLAAADGAQALGHCYFLTHPEPVSWSAFAATSSKIIGRSARTLTIPAWAADVFGLGAEWVGRLTGSPSILSRDKIREARCRYWLCDSRRAAAELGFTAETSFEQGLAETLAWYKETGWIHY